MVAANMTGHPPLHETAEPRFCCRLHHQMQMIRHQTEAKHVDGILGLRCGQQVEEGGVVAIYMKDHSSAIPTIEDVVGGDLTARMCGMEEPD